MNESAPGWYTIVNLSNKQIIKKYDIDGNMCNYKEEPSTNDTIRIVEKLLDGNIPLTDDEDKKLDATNKYMELIVKKIHNETPDVQVTPRDVRVMCSMSGDYPIIEERSNVITGSICFEFDNECTYGMIDLENKTLRREGHRFFTIGNKQRHDTPFRCPYQKIIDLHNTCLKSDNYAKNMVEGFQKFSRVDTTYEDQRNFYMYATNYGRNPF